MGASWVIPSVTSLTDRSVCFSNLFWTKINLVIHIVPVLEPLLLVFSSGGSFVDEKDVFRVAMRSAFTNR